jgi:hypothetical protein
MKKDELYDDLMELYESKNDALTIKSINLNEALFSKYKDRILVDVFETNYSANRMQLAIENKDIPKLIEFLNKNK